MKLRTIGLIVTLALGLLAGTLPAEAQEAGKVYRVGFLDFRFRSTTTDPRFVAFRQGLRELGYVEGQNLVLEYRSAEGKREQLPKIAAELVRLKVDVIVTSGSPRAIRAAQRATRTIPIVFPVTPVDPVAAGFVVRLARPGGNITGLTNLGVKLHAKRLELLMEVVPLASRAALLLNPTGSTYQLQLKAIQAAASALGVTVLPLDVKGSDDVDRAFATMRKERLGGFLQFIGLGKHRRRIVDLAAKSQLPAIYTHWRWVAAGGLMSYGASWPDLFRRAATFVDKILKGAKPGDLPIQQPKKFELVINLKTAKQISVTIPPEVLLRADKVFK